MTIPRCHSLELYVSAVVKQIKLHHHCLALTSFVRHFSIKLEHNAWNVLFPWLNNNKLWIFSTVWPTIQCLKSLCHSLPVTDLTCNDAEASIFKLLITQTCFFAAFCWPAFHSTVWWSTRRRWWLTSSQEAPTPFPISACCPPTASSRGAGCCWTRTHSTSTRTIPGETSDFPSAVNAAAGFSRVPRGGKLLGCLYCFS